MFRYVNHRQVIVDSRVSVSSSMERVSRTLNGSVVKISPPAEGIRGIAQDR